MPNQTTTRRQRKPRPATKRRLSIPVPEHMQLGLELLALVESVAALAERATLQAAAIADFGDGPVREAVFRALREH